MGKLLLLFFILLISSCNLKKAEPQIAQVKLTFKELQEIRLREFADSTVHLTFKGIGLGKLFKTTVKEAIKNRSIWKVKYAENGLSCDGKAKVISYNRMDTLTVDLKISSYQDTITCFLITSSEYDTYKSLKYLFNKKYNTNYSSSKNNDEEWGDKVYRLNSNSNTWNFKNQNIIMTVFNKEKRENYIKDSNMKSPQNRYGIKYTNYFQMITIIYQDKKQYLKIHKPDNTLKQRLEKPRSAIDSIKKEKEQHNKKILNQI